MPPLSSGLTPLASIVPVLVTVPLLADRIIVPPALLNVPALLKVTPKSRLPATLCDTLPSLLKVGAAPE